MVEKSRPINIGLLSHYFEDENLGCVALSISNIKLIDAAAKELGIEVQYRILVNEKHPETTLDFTDSIYSYVRYSSSKKTLKHPIRFLRSNVFENCDFVMNINAGDGFTDLYGFPRMISESYMNLLALIKRVPLVIAPQTIGPFNKRASRTIARAILRRSTCVFSRDKQSTSLSHDLGAGGHTLEVIDVAFSLPFVETSGTPTESPLVGINVSGLLYRGGYDRKNYFGLSFDYREFVHSQVARFLDAGAEVHLIAHVVSDPGSIEDDFTACEEVAREFPSVVVAPRFANAIDVKSYIAKMDFFTGARMHSTIAAISSGVAAVPIAYSKKLPGLYDTLRYPYYLDARADWTSTTAIDQIFEWYAARDDLTSAVLATRDTYQPRLGSYKTQVGALLKTRLEGAR